MVRTAESDVGRSKEVSGLAVFRVDTRNLARTCAIGEATSNEEARAIADDLAKTCAD
jgi:hypothetical protein